MNYRGRFGLLSYIARQTLTDKGPDHGHGFTDFYESFLRAHRGGTHPIRRVLEVGIMSGASLRMWSAYFPEAKVFGLDINPAPPELAAKGIECAIADADDPASLERAAVSFGGHFDLVVDDGGHTMAQQFNSFATLMPHVSSGGIFIMEDLHTSVPAGDAFGREEGKATMLDFVLCLAGEARWADLEPLPCGYQIDLAGWAAGAWVYSGHMGALTSIIRRL